MKSSCVGPRRRLSAFAKEIFSFSFAVLMLCQWVQARPSSAQPDGNAGEARGTGQEWLNGTSSVERRLEVGESHPYFVELAADEVFDATVVQKGVDVQVQIFAPHGEPLRQIDSPTSVWGSERVLMVAETAGVHRLEVRGILDALPSATYSFEVRKIGPASPRERYLHLGLAAAEKGVWIADRAHGIEGYERARAVRLEALQHFRAAGSLHGIVLATLHLAESERWLGRPRDALKRLRALLENLSQEPIQGPAKDPANHGVAEQGIAQQGIGTAALLDRDLTDEEDIFPWSRHRGIRSQIEASIGRIYAESGSPDKALRYFQSSLRLTNPEKAPRWSSDLLQDMGRMLDRLGEEPMAMEAFRESLEVLGAEGYSLGRASALFMIAELLESQGETQQALEVYERALPVALEIAERFTRYPNRGAICLFRISRLRATLGNLGAARQAYQAALERAQWKVRGPSENPTLLERAEADRALGHNGRARALFEQVLVTTPSWLQEQASLFALTLIDRDAGELARSLASSARNLEIIETRWTATELSRASFLARQLELFELHIDVLMRLHRLHPRDGYEVQAFETSERLRARELLADLPRGRPGYRDRSEPRDGSGRRDGSRGLWRQREALQEQLDAWGRRESRRLHQGTVLSPAERQVEEAELNDLLSRLHEIEAAVRSHSPRYAAFNPPTRLSLGQLQHNALAEGSLLLEYSLGEDRSFLWAVSTDSIHSFELPPRATLEAAALSFYDLLTARSRKLDFETPRAKSARVALADSKLPDAAHRLGTLLLGPVAHLLEDQQLLIVADGALRLIPFSALPHPAPTTAPEGLAAPKNGAVPLMMRHEVVTTPSASVTAALRQMGGNNRGRATKTLAIFADPVFTASDPRLPRKAHPESTPSISRMNSTDPLSLDLARGVERSARDLGLGNFERLPASREEAETVSNFLPAGESLRALGFAARRDAITSTGLRDFRIVHFATHAIRNAKHPELSGIVLSLLDEAGDPINGFLSVQDVYELDLQADLIVLSACKTALGREIRGEGLIGLPRAFMYAGAPAVIGSLWSPEDRPTAELMKRFYRGLFHESLLPATALRRAQMEMRRDPRWRAPYYWAAFSLEGDPRAAIR